MMQWLTAARMRFRSLFFNERVERELQDELAHHFEREVEARRADGLDEVEARRAAHHSLGAVSQNMDACRDERRVNLFDHAARDLRFALRLLAANPGFACTVLLVLTLGTAAAVTIFGFVDAAVLRPLPYEAPERLVHVFGTRPDTTPDQDRGAASYLEFRDWRERTRGFSAIAAYDVRAGFNMTTASGPERVRGLRVSSGFFRTLGVAPILGREFRADEEGPAAAPTAMLSYGAWQARFGGDPAVLGRTVTLQFPWLAGGEPHMVIGVLPSSFQFSMAGEAEFWTAIRGPQPCWEARSCQSLEVVARLADGVSADAASAHLTAILAQLRTEHPDHNREPRIARLTPLRDVMLGDIRPLLLLLLAAAGLLWLIAAINAVSLFLARSEVRRREIALRHALGASSGRLVLQFGTEALLLAVSSGALGLMLAAWSMRGLAGLLSADMLARMPYFREVGVNGRVMGFGVVLSLLLGLVLGLVPLVRTPRARTLDGLKDGIRGDAGSMWRSAGAPLVVAELAIALVLLVNAGLLGKSLYRLLNVDPGFTLQQLAQLTVSPVGATPEPSPAEQPARLAQRIAERVAAVPGVASVGYADIAPLAPALAPETNLWVTGRAEDAQLKGSGPVRRISADYFRTLKAPLERGREFTAADVTDTRPVTILNSTAARRHFRGEDPIGRSISFGGPSSPPREIVGVVADIADGPPAAAPHASAYVPFDQTAFALVVRTAVPEQVLLPAIVAAVHQTHPGLLVNHASSMTDRIEGLPSTALNRSSAWLVGGFAAIAFVLGVAGFYGVVAYTVGQRTREIGVRMALGAARGGIYRLVMRDAGRLVGLGTTIGLAAAVGFGTLLRHVLFDIESWDPATLAAASALLIVAALAASFAPARRAMSVNPVDVLRAD
jgi:macrolide transport system ATP-binding/permease protein